MLNKFLTMLAVGAFTLSVVACEEADDDLDGIGNDIEAGAEDAGDAMGDAMDDTEDAIEDATN
jgi:hypothetical protein